MKITPINGQILVKPSKPDEKSTGGIYIPDSGKEKPQEGKVIAMAKDATEEVAVGDRVIYKQFSGTEVSVEGEDYILLPSDEIIVKYVDVDAIPE
ncbi:MAG: co-chaperone GroES [Candidatus Euphemobacter frigidus]|nr:co-chaperone GroES [Candidatus Euphemobacter frigidus]